MTRRQGAGLRVGSSFAWHGGSIRLAQDQVSELPQLPVRVGGAEAFFEVSRDPHAVPGLQLWSVRSRGGGERLEVTGQPVIVMQPICPIELLDF
jgi:hypothetical protein